MIIVVLGTKLVRVSVVTKVAQKFLQHSLFIASNLLCNSLNTLTGNQMAVLHVPHFST